VNAAASCGLKPDIWRQASICIHHLYWLYLYYSSELWAII